MRKAARSALVSLCFLGAFSLRAEGFLEVEAGAAFTGYNDLRIPADSGSKISLADDTRPDPAFAFRVRGGYSFADRHSILVLVAPLTVRGSGTLDRDLSFQGKVFPAGTKLESSYRFDSYRLTYRYTFVKSESLALAAGLSAKLRSADIALMSEGAYAHRDDLGLVPLVSAMAEWEFARGTSLLVDAEALASPFGRAEDLLVALQRRLSDTATLRLGYRLLEGGSDGGGGVYTFALFNYATAGIRVRF
ncbi:MAG TPA: hypothetical protein P5142_09470 [Spirochaetia bacterium]|nr:hypothetical protein [Spirochaetia bacterium]